MAELSGKIIQELVLILRPFMRDKQERQAYLTMALGTNATVSNRLAWDTPVDVFIPQMVNELVLSGEITSGKPAICALLEVIYESTSVDIQPKIQSLSLQLKEELTLDKVSEVYRQDVEEYFTITLNKLREQGCLDIRNNFIHGNNEFKYVARIIDFELPFGLINMRGETFFMFSEFSYINMKILQRFSAQSLDRAKKLVNSSLIGQALYNFRVPTNICFAVAIVDILDDRTAAEVQTTNPLDHRLDLLWYEVPVIYEITQKRLYFYNQPSNFFENFKGEIVWKKLREVIQNLLSINC
ncbi:hypothetical protein [Dolichospermum sp. LEGE 00246]|uniref:hypothetical protein n=1 Tax=Dolichospermum sp. LEGE 00246 TaxID=1828605 RepID=UPI00187FC310|nr:hypothetical protein [Dolichospermum sp. LEGE 00246]MBE9257082.1 hypothetical protein [Dolichospermum sp. LEGE 00246]